METGPSIKVNPEDSAPIPDQPIGPQIEPKLARIYEIAFSNSADVLEFYYSSFHEFRVTSESEFLSEMARLIQSGQAYGNPPPPRDNDPLGDPIGTKLSVKWSDCSDVGYLVFRLPEKSNIQFSADYLPFTMEHANVANEQFVESGKFDSKGNRFSPRRKLEDCKYAFFTVNGPHLPKADPARFIRRFNIHVELLESNGGKVINRIPIIIDPDVRNPGGN